MREKKKEKKRRETEKTPPSPELPVLMMSHRVQFYPIRKRHWNLYTHTN